MEICLLGSDGGYDANWFEINAIDRKNFFFGKDYENPQDADQNNTYEVTIRATDLKVYTAIKYYCSLLKMSWKISMYARGCP